MGRRRVAEGGRGAAEGRVDIMPKFRKLVLHQNGTVPTTLCWFEMSK